MVRCERLTSDAFAPFGQVLRVPRQAGRDYFSERLSTTRPQARPSLSLAVREPSPLPLVATLMERHRFSSQSFVPMGETRWLVLVAPNAIDGTPDMARARAFLPAAGEGVTFAADVWHHPLTVLDRPGAFAITMWLDGTNGDEEFFTLPQPVPIEIG